MEYISFQNSMFFATFVTQILRQKIVFSPKIAKIAPNRYPHNAKKSEKNESY